MSKKVKEKEVFYITVRFPGGYRSQLYHYKTHDDTIKVNDSVVTHRGGSFSVGKVIELTPPNDRATVFIIQKVDVTGHPDFVIKEIKAAIAEESREVIKRVSKEDGTLLCKLMDQLDEIEGEV